MRWAQCLFSSLIGALLGAAVLAVSVPVIPSVVLKLGPPGFLMLTVLGLSFIVSLAGREPRQRVPDGGLGLSAGDGGALDPQSSIQRFTWDSLYLWEGIMSCRSSSPLRRSRGVCS